MPKKSSKAKSENAQKYQYQCLYCNQVFLSGRALGGHQNAHRFEPREKRRTHHPRVPMPNQTLAVPNPLPHPLLPGNGRGLRPDAPLGGGNRFPALLPVVGRGQNHSMQPAFNVAAPRQPWMMGGALSSAAPVEEDEVTSKMSGEVELDLELRL